MEVLQKQWEFTDLSISARLAAGLTLLVAEIIGIVGNTFVLIIIVRILKHRISIPNILIFILTVLDLITLPLTYTQAILSHLSGYYIGGQAACNYHGTTITFCKYASIFVISLTSLDRFIAMSYPFCYKDHLLYDETRKYRVASLLMPLLVVTGIISILPLAGLSRNVLQYPGSYCLFDLRNVSTPSAVLLGMHISFLVIIATLIVATNIGVCVQAQRLIQKIKPSLKVSKREAKIREDKTPECKRRRMHKRLSPKQEKKLLRTSILATGVFLICWLPYLVRLCLAISGIPFSEALDFVSARLVSLQSVIDPWMYPLTRRQYRSGFRLLFRKMVHSLSFGLIREPTTTLDEIIDARANRKEALKYYAERRKSQASKIEGRQVTENIELTDTASQTRDNSFALKSRGDRETSVTFNMEEENANIDGEDSDLMKK